MPAKKTFQPNKRKKAKTSGFFAKQESGSVKTRRAKGRKKLSN